MSYSDTSARNAGRSRILPVNFRAPTPFSRCVSGKSNASFSTSKSALIRGKCPDFCGAPTQGFACYVKRGFFATDLNAFSTLTPFPTTDTISHHFPTCRDRKRNPTDCHREEELHVLRERRSRTTRSDPVHHRRELPPPRNRPARLPSRCAHATTVDEHQRSKERHPGRLGQSPARASNPASRRVKVRPFHIRTPYGIYTSTFA